MERVPGRESEQGPAQGLAKARVRARGQGQEMAMVRATEQGQETGMVRAREPERREWNQRLGNA